MATSTVNENPLAWKLKGTASGNAKVTMPTEYSEILLWAQKSTTYFSIIVPKNEISASSIYPRFAFYYRADVCVGGYFEVNSTDACCSQWVENGGTSYLTQVTFKLYYR